MNSTSNVTSNTTGNTTSNSTQMGVNRTEVFGFDFEGIVDSAYIYYMSLKTLSLLSAIHTLIFFQHLMMKIAIVKLNRKPNHGIQFYVDLALFVTSLIVMFYF
mmetsp:Transcript_23249/g.17670  ORF Transcript_23249/g.17670 Transcript_23249/m.17670 type:complete len:103 (+) Transcript_23249:997-1305(+)